MKREEFAKKWSLEELRTVTPLSGYGKEDCLSDLNEVIKYELSLPPAEGAEEILTSLIKSLGEPIKIHNHIYEIRPYTVEGKTEWWMFHKGVGSGEPLAQWLNKFATLHAQRIAEKMVEDKLRDELVMFGSYFNNLDPKDHILVKDIDEYLKSKEQ